MREIKFKIYDKELKETHIEELQDLCEDDYWYDGETDIWSMLYDGTHKQERFVISLYTGLKDKNGVEIYEGDIVGDKNIKWRVKWNVHRMGFSLYPITEQIYDEMPINVEEKLGFEILGNIYENPELLEGR